MSASHRCVCVHALSVLFISYLSLSASPSSPSLPSSFSSCYVLILTLPARFIPHLIPEEQNINTGNNKYKTAATTAAITKTLRNFVSLTFVLCDKERIKGCVTRTNRSLPQVILFLFFVHIPLAPALSPPTPPQ